MLLVNAILKKIDFKFKGHWHTTTDEVNYSMTNIREFIKNLFKNVETEKKTLEKELYGKEARRQ